MQTFITSFGFLFCCLVLSPVVLPQTTLTVTAGTPTLDGVVNPGEWTSTPLVTGAGVTLNAMADGNFLYVSASWDDTTESIQKKEWSYNGAIWSQTGNEDRIGFIWDMGLNGTDGVNCQTMCHSPLMRTQVGKVDVWHWKSARGNAMGVVDDKYWNTVDRQSDPGTSAYMDNSPMGSGFPSFMGAGDPGGNSDFLTADTNAFSVFDPFGMVTAHAVDVAVPFDSGATFSSGSVIPGYLHRVPAGDRASVQSAGKYASGGWTVEFKRSYTGGDFDFTVVPGSSVKFTHEIFDNTGGGHPNDGYDATIYTLDFAQVITDVEYVAGFPTKYLLDQNYPNPFNPSTKIGVILPGSENVRLIVYNLLGVKIAVLMEGMYGPGTYELTWEGRNDAGFDVPAGLYFYRLEAGSFTDTKKLLLMK